MGLEPVIGASGRCLSSTSLIAKLPRLVALCPQPTFSRRCQMRRTGSNPGPARSSWTSALGRTLTLAAAVAARDIL